MFSLHRVYLLVECCSKSIRTTLNWIISCAVLSGVPRTLHRVFTCAIFSKSIILRQHWTGFFPVHTMLSRASWATLHKVFTCGIMLSQDFKTTLNRIFSYCCLVSLSDNIAQGFYLCNVGPWLTDNFYKKNNLYNVVLTILRSHCIGILSSQCCSNTS